MRFKDLSIRSKLIVGFGIMALINIFISFEAIQRIQQSGINTDLMYKHPLAVSNSVREVNIYINAIHRSMKDIVSDQNNENILHTLQEIKQYNDTVEEAFKIIFDRFLGNKEDVENAYNSFLKWEKIRNQIIDLKLTGKDSIAFSLEKNENSVFVKELLNKTKVMTDFAQNKADEFYFRTKKSELISKIFFGAISIILILTAVFFSIAISRSISNPIRKFMTEVSHIFANHDKSFNKKEIITENELLEKTVRELKELFKEIKISSEKLKSFNEELQAKVDERTKKLQKNEKILKENIEEYQSLNEEYMAQNEELSESIEQINAINAELKIAKIKAEESDSLKTAFLANMSHEIRTPMNAIIGFTDLIINPKLPKAKRVKYSNIIAESSKRLLAVVNDILDISLIETGQMEIKKEVMNVNELMMSLYDFYVSNNYNKKISLKLINGLDDHTSDIRADKSKINQVLNNLLSNAFKYTEKGYIHFGYEKTQKDLTFFVEDTGIGIHRDYYDKIFNRFERGNIEMVKTIGGTGLGLSISRKLVELWGGKIWFDSEWGKGTTFYFTLPFDQVITGDLKVQMPENELSLSKFNGFTVLIAEDEDLNFEYLEELFKETNAIIIRAKNGDEAIQYCREIPEIQLVLMDVKMPVLNGYEATKQIKQFRHDLPVIAQTAYGMSDNRKKAIENGCDDYISKPIIRDDLFAIINKYVRPV